MDPSKIIKKLLPQRFPWITSVPAIGHSGEVKRYTGRPTPDEVYQLYDVYIKVDPSKFPKQWDCPSPNRLLIENGTDLSYIIGRGNTLCLCTVVEEINTLMTINAKYNIWASKES